MRKLVLGLALSTSALAATPALAREDAWYVELDAGATMADNIGYRNVTGTLVNGLDTDIGYDVGGIVGYDFGAFRLEAETAYKRVGNKRTFFGGPGFAGVKGRNDALSFMVNGLVDLGPDDGLQAFAGGGVGVARVHSFIPTAVSVGTIPGTSFSGLDDSDSGFAWQ